MPEFIGSDQPVHSRLPKVGIILTNLGSPDAPTKPAVKRYLAEFLADPRIVEFPRALWWLILHGVILKIRPRRSAKAYQKVWSPKGSPLVALSQALTDKVRELFNPKTLSEPADETIASSEQFTPENNEHFYSPSEAPIASQVEVALAMRYGNPSIESVMMDLRHKGVERLIVLPLYPQYSASTTASTFDKLAEIMSKLRWQPSLQFLPAYHDHPTYIESIAASIRTHWENHRKGEKLIFTYHGLPQKYLHRGDPYHCQCHKTSRLIAQALGLEKYQWATTFQSRFGREAWLQPYTNEVLKALPEKGIEAVDLICPGFSIDCLETLEEIDMEARQSFVDAGGKVFRYIPCLNDNELHVSMIQKILKPYIAAGFDNLMTPADLAQQKPWIEKISKNNPNSIPTEDTKSKDSKDVDGKDENNKPHENLETSLL